MSNTLMARQIDTKGIRLTVGGATLMLLIFLTSYIVLTASSTIDPIRLISPSNEQSTPKYNEVAISYICGFVAMLCEFFMIRRLGAKSTEEE